MRYCFLNIITFLISVTVFCKSVYSNADTHTRKNYEPARALLQFPPGIIHSEPMVDFFPGYAVSPFYYQAELNRIEMITDNFRNYSSRNSIGKFRDTVTNQGVDYFKTNLKDSLNAVIKQKTDSLLASKTAHSLYKPLYRNDGQNKPVKYIIILIGDGTGLAQWYAGYTANHASLNVFAMRHIGLSKTSSLDNYITDSAPGATSISSGVKTNNRAVGVDHKGARLTLLPDIIAKRKMKTAIITSGDFRDATPASFYGHRSLRSDFKGMMEDLVTAKVDIIMGACNMAQYDSVSVILKKKFNVLGSLNTVNKSTKLPLIVADSVAAFSIQKGRNDWATTAFQKTLQLLSKDKNGFLIMLEGAQIDHGGHANQLTYVVSELLDFDQVIGKAMEFADSNGETLVIVTGDHETGGLTLTGGDYGTGMINGQFSTGGHTAIPVPVFAYGPQSQLFGGVYENTDIFFRILKALKSDYKPLR